MSLLRLTDISMDIYDMTEKEVRMDEDKVLSFINSGTATPEILDDAMPTAARRFYRLTQSMHTLLGKSESIFLMLCFIPLTAR